MSRRHEQSVIDGFFDHFKRKAVASNRRLIRCSLDGQDAIYGADYLFTNNSRFVLTEFKYQEANLVLEGQKPRRLQLCRLLDKDTSRRKQSLFCHYVAWSIANQSTLSVQFNQYYPEICGRHIFGATSDLVQLEASIGSRRGADSLIESFLNQSVGGNYYTFKKYTDWLYSLKGNGAGAMELILDNPDSEQLELIKVSSLQKLKLWLESSKSK